MSQTYHRNARTNSHVRQIIQQSRSSVRVLAEQFGISEQTVSKWRHRRDCEDRSSRPHRIHYALSDLEKALICLVRRLTWMPLDDLVETLQSSSKEIRRSSVYRTLRSSNLSRVPDEKRVQAKSFKEYRPGYVHMDVTYLPMIEGVKYYLFVAIDRATRLLYYRVYPNRTAQNAVNFLEECRTFFPFEITHILTDNGMEFTNRFYKGATQPNGNHRFDKLCQALGVEHRLTQPSTPQTNGMVERVNGIIKNHTVKVLTYQSLSEMTQSLNTFLLYYLFTRRHGGLCRELKVRTPYDALHYWYNLEPSLFHTTPEIFRASTISRFEQRGET